MGLDIKKILSMSGAIAASVVTGGVTAPIIIPAALNLASEFIPKKDTFDELICSSCKSFPYVSSYEAGDDEEGSVGEA